MGDVIWGHDFTARKSAERAEQAKFEHEVCQIAFEGECFPFAADGGPVVLTCLNGETMEVYGAAEARVALGLAPSPVEMPADCPA